MNTSEINLYVNKFKLLSEYDNKLTPNENIQRIDEGIFTRLGHSLGFRGKALRNIINDFPPQIYAKYSNMSIDQLQNAARNLSPGTGELKYIRKMAALKQIADLEAKGLKLDATAIDNIINDVKTKFEPKSATKKQLANFNRYNDELSTPGSYGNTNFKHLIGKLNKDQMAFLAKTDQQLSSLGSKQQIVQSAGNMNQQSFVSYYRDYFNAIGITLAMAGLVYWYYNRVYNGGPEQFKTNILPDYSIKSQ